MTRQSEESPLSEILKSFIKENHLDSGLNKVEVQDAWKELMGPGVNKYTSKIRFEEPTLFVYLTSSVLREELSYGKEKIIAMLNEHIGIPNLITKIVLR
ncbi:DUF721 domain-containing protein [Aegicerativicinus sediminis]|uniref:DUF721 domain-containing protein n=1 Tax=Aegicerativicinus sediminis TaxID=2893202 RepID=UPI001E4ABE64|nr:DUF721 domain-containing protein [Aegicerativicinus sediminis]